MHQAVERTSAEKGLELAWRKQTRSFAHTQEHFPCRCHQYLQEQLGKENWRSPQAQVSSWKQRLVLTLLGAPVLTQGGGAAPRSSRGCSDRFSNRGGTFPRAPTGRAAAAPFALGSDTAACSTAPQKRCQHSPVQSRTPADAHGPTGTAGAQARPRNHSCPRHKEGCTPRWGWPCPGWKVTCWCSRVRVDTQEPLGAGKPRRAGAAGADRSLCQSPLLLHTDAHSDTPTTAALPPARSQFHRKSPLQPWQRVKSSCSFLPARSTTGEGGEAPWAAVEHCATH